MAVIVALVKMDKLIAWTLHTKVLQSLDPQHQRHKKCGRCEELRPEKSITGQQTAEEINVVGFFRQVEGKEKAAERRCNGAIKVRV